MKKLRDYTGKSLQDCTILELYNAALELTQDACKDKGYNSGKKKVYYISAEFLIGKLLSNNLINLGIYDEVKAELAEAGKDITDLEEFEYEPSLGNGGLGRLAACFIDSLATLGLPADGVGLAYHCGLFKQSFEDNKQHARPDYWRQHARPDYWRKWGMANWMRRTDRHYKVQCGDLELVSTMYEIDVTGYGSKCGRLRLFDLDTVNERLIGSGIDFDKEEIEKNLTLFLYPDDSDEAGRMLRVYQEYFMVSNAAQLIIDECVERGSDLHDLADYAAIQINDTHPSLVIPELVRILAEKGIEEEEAYQIVTDVCAYTNHTILAEALETWPKHFFKAVVPHLMPIIKRISVNGVARLHTEILKNTELNNFYKLYPEKFNNKTNGITFRRWVVECNPELTELISEKIGEGWKTDAKQLEQLLSYAEDPAFLQCIVNRKNTEKKKFADWLYKYQGDKVDPESVYDVQIKRLHEYKRQQLNLLWAIDCYLHIKDGYRPRRPITVFFGAKAAPAYVIAKDIIHAILAFGKIVNNDPDVSPYLKVIMLRNYNVSMAEKLINGAVTLGTMDGANVEIAELVGEDNIFTFGQSSEEVIERYKRGDYVSKDWYKKNKRLQAAVDFLVSDEMEEAGDKKLLKQLYEELLKKDWFMTFPDFESYCKAKEKALAAYEDRMGWAKKMAVNIAKAGYFSSDRTIEQYNKDIWHLEKDC